MPYSTRIQEYSLEPDSWLKPIGYPEVADFDTPVEAMQHLYDQIEADRPGNWTYHLFDARGVKYSLNAAYLAFTGKEPRPRPDGLYRYPEINRGTK
jgi:hypothetical protein